MGLRFLGFLFVVLAAPPLLGIVPPPGQQQILQQPPVPTFVVDTTNDTADPTPDGTCANANNNNKCSLREAIQESNAKPGPDVIGFQCSSPPCQYKPTLGGGLTLAGDLTIYGKGKGVTVIDGDHSYPLFYMTGTNVTLSGITIQNGKSNNLGGGVSSDPNVNIKLINVLLTGNHAPGGGGGLFVNQGDQATLLNVQVDGNTTDGSGGGIRNNGTLLFNNGSISGNQAIYSAGIEIGNNGSATLSHVAISGNTAQESGGGLSNAGTVSLTDVTLSGNGAKSDGGIFNSGKATLKKISVEGNTVTNDNGGIENYGGAEMDIADSTISGNKAKDTGGILNRATSKLTMTNVTLFNNEGTGSGGSLWNAGTAVLTNVTVSGNATGQFAGGIQDTGSSTTLKNTIIATNGGGNCGGKITSQGGNLDSDGTCVLNGPGDQSNKDPLLGPFQNNGGSTKTLALFPGSQAIDAGDSNVCPATDQRGIPRPQIKGCDIGAFEIAQSPIPIFNVGEINFPETTVGQTSPGHNLTVTNAGNESLKVTSVTPDDQNNFKIAGDGCSGQTIAANANCAVTVSFTPTAAQDLKANLNLTTSNAGNKSVVLAGIGVAAAQDMGTGDSGGGPGDNSSGTKDTEDKKSQPAADTSAPSCSCRLIH